MKFLATVVFLLLSLAIRAQDINFSALDAQRIATNKTGMAVLGSWGIANIVAGTTGYFIASDKQTKAFHGMNAIWGATNALIALGGYAGARKEAKEQRTFAEGIKRHESVKRLYLINAGLDVLYIGIGALLVADADRFNQPEMWRGFGKSFVVQGAALLLFDGIMFAAHQKQNKNWYKLLEGVSVTSNGIGYRHVF
jgi:hypothetical protein